MGRGRSSLLSRAFCFLFFDASVFDKPPTAANKLLQESDPVSNGTSAGEPLRHVLFSREESATIEKACSDASIRVNDLANAMLFQTFEQWEQSHGDGKAIRYRVMMPVDLRSRKDLDLPVTNRLSFAFLGRRKDQCGEVDALVQGATDEVLAIKDSRVHMDFLDGLSAAIQHPRLTRWVIDHSRQMVTSVITYTGDLSRGMRKFVPEVDGQLQIGDATLRNALGSPPAREGTHVSLGICINWGQICIAASWNREVWDAATTDQFLEGLHEQLASLVATTGRHFRYFAPKTRPSELLGRVT